MVLDGFEGGSYKAVQKVRLLTFRLEIYMNLLDRNDQIQAFKETITDTKCKLVSSVILIVICLFALILPVLSFQTYPAYTILNILPIAIMAGVGFVLFRRAYSSYGCCKKLLQHAVKLKNESIDKAF